ncbi:site-specific DNA-methyltransferase [Selenomonas bovis]|uniref:site-specific DNA-methyltransferase n=1 Tax=Selenomonas bovis TaxID=416586 RepID=UPI001F0E3060|nr:site-specific DNA-methyltransferase [Selenomonas bovis]
MNQKTEYYLADIDTLVPYARNARTHSPEQVAQIAASIREFGFLSPVVTTKDGTILCGHGRFYAAQKLGLKKIPCIREDHLTEAQRRAYIIADNKLSLNAGWDEEMLRVELSDLKGEDFDVSLTGFDEKELARLFAEEDGAEEDGFDVDAELEKPCFSKAGDVWHLGRHTVICGDSTKPETYSRLLGKEKVNLVCTDPPYLVNLESTSGKIKNDDLSDEEGYKFLRAAFEQFHEAMAKDASIYVFYATAKARVFHDAYEDAGFKVGAGLVWKKNRLVLTRTDWKYIHEPIIWGWRKDGKHEWYGDQKQVTVFEFDRIKDSKKDGCGHPSSKPVPLIAYLIRQCTQTNGLVLDGFLGSASTLIACEQLGRVCYGVELEPKFVDVAVKRYLEFRNGDAADVYVERNGEKIPYERVEKTEEDKA